MNYFDTVKEKIADYIVKEPVVETDEVISAYTLFSILDDCNKRLRHTEEMGKGLLDKLNVIYPQVTVERKGKFFKKKIKENQFNLFNFDIHDNYSRLTLDGPSMHYIYLFKDYDYADIYSKNYSLTDEAYNKCIDDIEDIFSELEYTGKLFRDEKKSSGHKNSQLKGFKFYDYDADSISNTITYEGFDIKIRFDRFPTKFKYNICLNKHFDPNENSYSHYYNQENNLNNILEENKEAILKNTPINIGDLSYMFCMLVLDYKAIEEKKEEEKQYKKLMDEIKMNED